MASTSSSPLGADQQWATGRPDQPGDSAFYLRRTDGNGRPVVLELHLGLHGGHALAQVHVYDAPGDHEAGSTATSLEGCTVRFGGLPARGIYEDWLTAGRDNRVVYQALAELEVPDPAPPLPAAAQRTIDDLTAQVERLQQVIDAAGLNVKVPGELLAVAAERRARQSRR